MGQLPVTENRASSLSGFTQPSMESQEWNTGFSPAVEASLPTTSHLSPSEILRASVQGWLLVSSVLRSNSQQSCEGNGAKPVVGARASPFCAISPSGVP